MRSRSAGLPLALLGVLLLASCGGDGGGAEPPAATPPPAAGADAAPLSEEQLTKGIGPVTSVQLGPIDHERAEAGRDVFETKCSACHRLDERYVGPPLGDVLDRRTPEFVMNMILNPDEMVKRHPVIKELLAQYYTPMTNQGLTEEQARAVLEYIRESKAPG
jgi:cytochrome c